MPQQLKGFLWLVLVIGCGTLAAVGLPYFAKCVPWSVEKKAAQLMSFPSLQCSSDASPVLEKFTRRLYPILPDDATFPVTVHVVRDSHVNATAGLGGDIRLNNALLHEAESPEELAAVLAHEIEHVHHRHVMQGVIVNLSTIGALQFLFSGGSRVGENLSRIVLTMRFSRDQEAEADQEGLKRLRAAHVDVAGFIAFFNRLGRNGSSGSFLSDHPAPDDRAAQAERYKGGDSTPVLTPAEWQALKEICQ